MCISQAVTAEVAGRAGKELADYIDIHVEKKLANPGNDLLSRLVHEQMIPGNLERNDLLGLVRFLLIAGHETTANTMALSTVALLQHPDQLADLKANLDDATFMRNAVDEMLRYLSVAHTGRRRVTLSTSGLVPQIYKLAEECNVALAVSLHAPNDALRNDLVPINRKHPIDELLAACWHYIDVQNGRSVTFEYVMLDAVNDKPEHARQLARLLKGRPAKLNLIPFNAFPGTRYRRSPAAAIVRFRDILNEDGVIATIRRTRGDDIDAACGQLAGRVTDRTLVRLGTKLTPAARAPVDVR